MSDIVYNIVMKTPVGLRYGTMTLCMIDNRVYGVLDLLEHAEAFNGTVDSDGNCTICGCLVTLTKTISYTAVGKVSPKTIALSLQGDRNIFEITGIAVPDNEVKA